MIVRSLLQRVVIGAVPLLVIVACSPVGEGATPAPRETLSATPGPEVPTMAVPSPSPSSNPITTADDAIAAVQRQFPQMQKVKRSEPATIGASTDITVLERPDGWDLVFWEGWGDCPSGCINNRYHYFSVERNGRIVQVGEYARIFDSSKNTFDVTGSPMWGVPRTP